MPRSLNWSIYAALIAIVAAPLWGVTIPALGDTLNHLARMHVLLQIDASPTLQRFYAVHWTPIPYLAMDAIVPLLARAFPLSFAGKLFVLGCALSPVLGAASLHYVLHRRISLVPAAAFLLSYNYLLATGFLNYLFTLGLAVLLFALWVASDGQPRWWRAAVFSPFVLLLYFGHAFACAGYCLSVAGYELSRAWQARSGPVAPRAADLLAAGAQAVPALWFAATLDVGTGYVGSLQTSYGTVSDKLTALLSPVMFLTDRHAAPVLIAALLLVCVAARWLVLARTARAAALAVGIAAACMPNMLLSTWGTDLRFPLFTAVLLLGCVSVRAPPAWLKPFATVTLIVLVAIKSAYASLALQTLDAQVAQTRGILAALPPGMRLLVVDAAGHHPPQSPLPPNTRWNLPMVAVIDRDAFVPYVFNGLTTMRMQPPFLLSSTPNGFPLTPQQLRDNVTTTDQGGARVPAGEAGGSALYWRGWPDKFDFVLVMRFGLDPGRLPDDLVPVAHSADLDLYRIAKTASPG